MQKPQFCLPSENQWDLIGAVGPLLEKDTLDEPVKKGHRNFTGASVFQIVGSIIPSFVSAVLLVSSFATAQGSGDKRLPEKESQKLDSDSVEHFAKLTPHLAQSASRRQLSLADRVAYQYAIEEVYWRHRIWPRSGGENSAPKPLLDQVMSPAQIQQKVKDYLRNSRLLSKQWHRPITPKQLQSEMERMASQTKQS